MNLYDTCEETVHDCVKIRLILRQNERQGPVHKRSQRLDLGSPQKPANRGWTFVSGPTDKGVYELGSNQGFRVRSPHRRRRIQSKELHSFGTRPAIFHQLHLWAPGTLLVQEHPGSCKGLEGVNGSRRRSFR